MSVAITGCFTTALIVGCGGTGQICSAIFTVDGRTHGGTDRDPEQAKSKACSRYCVDGDPEFDNAYQDWLRSPESKGVPDRDSRSAASASDPGLKKITAKCETKCRADIVNGSLNVNVKCK